jgi:hypothetical protein
VSFETRCKEVASTVRATKDHLNKIKAEAYKPVVEQLLLIYGIELARYKFKPGREFRFEYGMGCFTLGFGPHTMFGNGDATNMSTHWRGKSLLKTLQRIMEHANSFNYVEDDTVPCLLDGSTIPLTSKEIP